MRWKTFRKNSPYLIMTIPAVLKIFIFSYVPMFGIIIAFQNYRASKGLLHSEFVGFKNFEFFFKSIDAGRILWNTLYLNSLMIATGLIVSIVVSLLLFEITSKFRLKIYQSVMFFPFFFSWVLVGLMMGTFLNSDSGLLTRLIHFLTGTNINFYTSPEYWPLILVLVDVWKATGYSSLIYYAVLMSIDKDYYEAAEIDGASRIQKMFYITLPFLIPMAIVLTILAIGNIMRADFGLFYFVPREQGALFATTDVIDTYVFRALRQYGDFAMSSAVSLFQSVVGFVLILATNALVGKYNEQHKLY